MEPIVSLKNITVEYDSTVALEGVSLDIYPDDFLGVIGPNGGGKTTLVKAILDAVPHSGEVSYSPTLFERGHRLIGYLPQLSEFDKSFPISVVEVVMSGLQAEKGFFARYTKADREKAMQLLDMAGIADIAERQISEISGGQMQRALLCRAVILEPKLLILDEPTNFVDNKFENELYTLLHRLNDYECSEEYCLRKLHRSSSRLEHHNCRTIRELPLSNTDYFARTHSTYSIRTPSLIK